MQSWKLLVYQAERLWYGLLCHLHYCHIWTRMQPRGLCPFSKHINLLLIKQTLQLVSMMPLLHYQKFMALMGWINPNLAIQNLKHSSFVWSNIKRLQIPTQNLYIWLLASKSCFVTWMLTIEKHQSNYNCLKKMSFNCFKIMLMGKVFIYCIWSLQVLNELERFPPLHKISIFATIT